PHLPEHYKRSLVNQKPFTVIGGVQKNDNFFVGDNDGGNQNRAVYVPYESMKKMFPAEKDHFVMAQAEEGKLMQAQDEIRSLLRRRRGVAYDAKDNFGLSTPDAIADQFHQITGGI